MSPGDRTTDGTPVREDLFPTPREIVERGGLQSLAGARCILGGNAGDLERSAEALLKQAAGAAEAPGTTAPSIRIGEAAGELPVPDHPQGYALVVDGDGARLRGATPIGTWYGAQTLARLIRRQPAQVPNVSIRDWPAMDTRGLFIECKWGPDLMSLADWEALIDYATDVRFNIVSIGLYGCWVIQYDNAITEFLMVPLPEVPDAATRKRVSYYSALQGKTTTADYLPPMFEEDFLGRLIAYGAKRGVKVPPLFNSLGHNTLLPRLVPSVSAVDESGLPTGYGYCTSSPETRRLVFSIYDRILDRYLFPNGVRSFHLGLDEVWDTVGIDPSSPQRVVQPWCKCEVCRRSTPEDLFLDWLFTLAEHLVERGVEEIGISNDQLTRHMTLLNEGLASRIREAGLDQHLVIEWWDYGPTPSTKGLLPHLGLKRWLMPMAGYYHWLPYQSYLTNIDAMMTLGERDGATGVESYCSFDLAFDRNYRYLAERAWNPKVDVDSFRQAYGRRILAGDSTGAAEPEDVASAEEAMVAFDRAVTEGDLLDIVRLLMPYRYTYVSKERPYPRHYPQEVIKMLQSEPDAKKGSLLKVARWAGRARLLFGELSRRSPLAGQYAAESERIEVLASTFVTIMDIGTLLAGEDRDRQVQAHRLARMAVLRWTAMMGSVELLKSRFLLPQELRDLTTVRNYLVRLEDSLRDQTGDVPTDLLMRVAGASAG